jgi:hypothetical protein
MRKYHRCQFVFVGLVISPPQCAIVTRQSGSAAFGSEIAQYSYCKRSGERGDDDRFAKKPFVFWAHQRRK